jgi:hypothetical protein
MRMVVPALLLALAACDVGSVLTENQGGQAGPDAGGTNTGGQVDAATGGGGTGTMSITFTASQTANPQYAPAHVVVAWIEGPGGAFVKTVSRYADVRRSHLVAWLTGAGGVNADPDAVSGATRTSYAQPVTFTWNLQDRQNAVVPDGTYTIRLESTDRNSTTAAENNQGTFTFVKGTAPQMQTGLTNGGFSAVSINFTP